MGERWGLGNSGNRDLSAMIEAVAVECGDQPDLWPKRLVHQLVLGGLDERAAARRMTGDWIIFAKHEGRNFYLDLGTHDDATRDPDARVRAASGNSRFSLREERSAIFDGRLVSVNVCDNNRFVASQS